VNTSVDEARGLLENAPSIAILTHTRPDGDAVSSLLALFLSLSELGRQVTAVLHDPLPPRFQSLPGADQIEHQLQGDEDLLIVVDCATPDRISLSEEERPSTVDINIDHHPTNPRFGKVNIVNPEAVSTTQVLYDMMLDLNFPITPDVASNLMAGLITDTIGFRTQNVGPQVFTMAAELLGMGIPYAEIYQNSLTEQSYSSVKYWGCGLGNLNREDSLAWTHLSLQDRAAVGYQGNDDADLTNLLSAIEGVQVAVIFIEQQNGKVKVSFRSKDGINVSVLAEKFGGGGHAAAAGAMLEGKLDDTIEKVLAATREYVYSHPELA
jgi:phosphoesterase RecJ-like protein